MRSASAAAAVFVLLAATGASIVTTVPNAHASATTDGFTPLAPARLLDTRFGNGAPRAAVLAHSIVRLQVAGRAGLPSIPPSAVVLNVTVTQPEAAGFITVFANGSPRPLVSNLNFAPGQTIPNAVIAPVGRDGYVDLYNGSTGSLQLVADVFGMVVTTGYSATGSYHPVTPDRTADTRRRGSGPVAAHGTLNLPILRHSGVPAGDVSAVVLNVTVTQPRQAGYLTVYPDSTSRPVASNLNFGAHQTVANLVLAPVAPDGTVSIYNGSDGTSQIVADVFGWVSGTAAAGVTVPVPRSTPGVLTAGSTITLHVAGYGGVPSTGATAAVLNVTAVSPTAPGYLTVYPSDVARTATSNLNFVARQVVPNLVVSPLSANGEVTLLNGSAGQLHVVADVVAYVSAADASIVPLTPDRILDTRFGTGAWTMTPAWLMEINKYRVGAGLTPVANQPQWQVGLEHHLTYMARTSKGYYTGDYQSLHSENPRSPYYTADGAQEASRSDLFENARGYGVLDFMDGWLEAPFHAIGMLRPQLTQVAFAADSTTGDAGLDVIGGLDYHRPPATQPVLFPGPGVTTNLTRFGGELPTPLETCNWQSLSAVGLPLVALLPSAPVAGLSASITGPSGAVQSSAARTVCIVDSATYRSSDRVYGPAGASILQGDRAVLLVARSVYRSGTYTAVISQPGRDAIRWSFHVA